MLSRYSYRSYRNSLLTATAIPTTTATTTIIHEDLILSLIRKHPYHHLITHTYQHLLSPSTIFIFPIDRVMEVSIRLIQSTLPHPTTLHPARLHFRRRSRYNGRYCDTTTRNKREFHFYLRTVASPFLPTTGILNDLGRHTLSNKQPNGQHQKGMSWLYPILRCMSSKKLLTESFSFSIPANPLPPPPPPPPPDPPLLPYPPLLPL